MTQTPYPNARILIVDDEPFNILVLERMLEEWGFANVQSTTDSQQALALFLEVRPHAVLLDLMMPGLDGYAVMKQLSGAVPDPRNLGIMVLTADVGTEIRLRALEYGAKDFLTKPFDGVELSLRLTKILEIQFLHDELRQQNQMLEQRVVERTQQLANSEHETAICLSVAGEYRDDDTGRHTQRVGATAAVLARYSGLSNTGIDLILQAAPLHDVGKIGIPDSILLKPGRLTAEEFDFMKTHCQIGHSILSRHHTPLLQFAARIAMSHHERWDGSGYPYGLGGDDIPLEGRIVAIVDVFDALTHERPYKEAWPVEKAVAEIQTQAGRQFDPHLIDLFINHFDEVMQARAGGAMLPESEP